MIAGRPALWFSILLLSATAAAAAADGATACDRPLPEIFRDVSPGVLVVSAIRVNPFAVADRVGGAIGSGFVIDDEGHVLTAAHVVYASSHITVSDGDGGITIAGLVGLDPILDLALLKVPPPARPIPALAFGDSDALEIGTEIAAIGSSFGLEKTLTQGIVSGLNRRISESTMGWLQPLIQIDAAIGLGMSGGPLLDRCGRVVGILAMAMTDAGTVGFAVPSNIVQNVVPQLKQHGRVIRPWYGVYGRIVDPLALLAFGYPPVRGFLVETVEPGSPAAAAGLRGGSLPVRIGFEEYILGGAVLIRVNDTPMTDAEGVVNLALELEVGDTVAIEYFQDGEVRRAELTLTERPLLPSDLARWQ